MSLAQKLEIVKLESGSQVPIWVPAWALTRISKTYAVEIGGEGPQRERINGEWRRCKSLQELREENEVLEREIAQYQLGEGGWWSDTDKEDDDNEGWEIRKKRKERSRSRSRRRKDKK